MFEHLSKLDPNKRPAWFEIPEVGAGARVECRFAGDSNPAYLNAKIRRQSARPASRNVAEVIRLDREDDAAIFPTAIFTGRWECMRGADGSDVPFSAEHARDLIRCLPEHLFDRLRNQVKSASRFLDEEELAPDQEALAKN